MKTPDHDYELHLGSTAKPGIQKTLDCRSDLRNLCGRPRQRSDLDDEYFTGSFAIVDVDRGVTAFFLFTLPAGALADKVDRQKLAIAKSWYARSMFAWPPQPSL